MDVTVVLFLAPIILISCIVGTVRFNSLKKNWEGIIGVGGAWLSVMGIVMTIAVLVQLIFVIAGRPTWNVGEWIGGLAICLLGAYFLAKAELRCQTVSQRICLIGVCWLLVMGFAWRFLFSLLSGTPITTSDSTNKDKSYGYFPNVIYDTYKNNDAYELQSILDGDTAHYYNSEGQLAVIHLSNLNGDKFSSFNMW